MEIPSTVGSAYLRFWVQSAPHLLSKQNPQHPFPNEPIRDLLLPLHQHSRHWYLLNDAHDVPLHGHYQVRKQRRPCSKRLRPMFWRILPSTFHLHLPPYHDDNQGRHRLPLHYHHHRQRPHQAQPPRRLIFEGALFGLSFLIKLYLFANMEERKASDNIAGITAIAIFLALVPLFLEFFHMIVHHAHRTHLAPSSLSPRPTSSSPRPTTNSDASSGEISLSSIDGLSQNPSESGATSAFV